MKKTKYQERLSRNQTYSSIDLFIDNRKIVIEDKKRKLIIYSYTDWQRERDNKLLKSK